MAVTAVLVSAAALLPGRASAATPHSAATTACRVDHAGKQICGASANARAGRRVTIVIAEYEDLSNCNFASPSDQPGNNGRYVVRDIRVNWGDGTRTTTAKVKVGKHCDGTETENETGEIEHVIGTHRYKKAGIYTANVRLTYLRGKGNTYKNCARVTGATRYNIANNCIAFGAPAVSTVRVSRP